MKEDAFIHDHTTRDTYQKLKDTLSRLDKPIMQMRDDIFMIKNNFESWSSFDCTFSPVSLTFYKELKEKRLSAGCPKWNTEIIMIISQRAYLQTPVSGYSQASSLLSGDNRVCHPYSGFMGYVSDFLTAFRLQLIESTAGSGKTGLA